MGILRRAATPAGPVCRVADVSEFQGSIDIAAYLKWSRAIIIRGLYGSGHVDKCWFGGQRRNLLHSGGALFVGIYAYVTAAESAVVQARALLDLVGELRPGEKLIADIEEGAGSQAGRWQAWARTVKAATGEQPWLYSGLSFSQAAGLAPDWVAAYQRNEPRTPHPHLLWQFTDRLDVPGVGRCDASIFHGSVEELAALAHQPQHAKTATGLPVLKPGDRDTHEPWMVRRVQGLIGALGTTCQVDGTFGQATEAALKDFQGNHGIPQTGITDPATWAMLLYGRAVP